MAGGQINFKVGYTVDKTGLQQVRASIQEILNMKPTGVSEFDNQLKIAQQDAQALSNILTQSFNKDLGTINIQKFNNALKASSLDLNKIQASMTAMGHGNAFRSMAAQVLTTNMQLKQTHSLLDSMATTMANTVKWGIASSVMNTFTGKVKEAYGFVKSLDTSLNNIRIVTEKSADDMERFARTANKAAKELSATTKEYTDAALIYYQQGDTDAVAQAKAEVTLKTANVTQQSTSEVSEQLTAVWNGYKVSAEEAELYVDKLAAVAATTASDLEELSTGMSKVAAAANTMGVDVDQLNAQLSTIISVTRQAPESVGTALKTIYARMGDLAVDGEDEFGVSLGEVSGKMEQMGIQILDQQGDLRDMGVVIEETAEKWKSWTDAQKQAAAVAMAGKRQYNNLIALFDNWDKYEKALTTSSNALGTLDEQNEIYADSIAAHLKELKTSTEGFYDSLMDADGLNPLIDSLATFMTGLDNVTQALGGMGPILLMLGSTATRVFSKHLANGIATSVGNIKVAKENVASLNASLEVANKLRSTGEQDTRLQKMVTLKKEILQLGEAVSNEEHEILNELIKQTEEIYRQQDALEARKGKVNIGLNKYIGPQDKGVSDMTQEERDAAINDLTDIRKDLNAESKGLDSLIERGRIEDEILAKKEREKDIEKELSVLREDEKSDTEKIKELEKEQTQIIEKRKALQQRLSDPLNNLSTAQESVSQIHETIKTFELGEEATRKVNEAMVIYRKELAEVGKGSKTTEQANLNLAKALRSILGNSVKEVDGLIEELKTDFNAVEEELRQAGAAAEGAGQKFKESMNLKATIQGITSAIGALGQLASSINTLSNLSSIWKNEDLTTGEKFLQIITNLGFAVPMLLSSLGLLAGGIGSAVKMQKALNIATALGITNTEGLTLAEIKEAAVKKLVELNMTEEAAIQQVNNSLKKQSTWLTLKSIVADKASAVGKGLLTLANKKVTISLLGMQAAMWQITLIAAAVAAVIYTVTKAINAEAEAAERAAEAAKNQREKYTELNGAYEETLNTIENYKSARDGLAQLESGTDAWGESVRKLNAQVLELITKYPELAKEVKNINGELHLTDAALNNIKKKQEEKLTMEFLTTIEMEQSAADAQLQLELKKGVGELKDIYKKTAKEQDDSIKKLNLSTEDLNALGQRYAEIGEGVYETSELENIFGSLTDEQAERIRDIKKSFTPYLEDIAFNTQKKEKEKDEYLRLLLGTAGSETYDKNPIVQSYVTNQYDKEFSARSDEIYGNYKYKSYDDYIDAMGGNSSTEAGINTSFAQSVLGSEYLRLNPDAEMKFSYNLLDWGWKYYDADGKELTWDQIYAGTRTGLRAEDAKKHSSTVEETSQIALDIYNTGEALSTGLGAAILDTKNDESLNFTNQYRANVQQLGFINDKGNIEFTEKAQQLINTFYSDLGFSDTKKMTDFMRKGLENYYKNYDGSAVISAGQGKIKSVSSALSTLAEEKELDSETITDLENKYTELAKIRDKGSQEYIDALETIRENEEALVLYEQAYAAEDAWRKASKAIDDYQKAVDNKAKGPQTHGVDGLIEDEKLKEDMVEALDALTPVLDDFFNKQYELEISVTNELLTDVENIINKAQNAQTAISAIGDGFRVAAEDSIELFKIFPELAENAQILADGTIQLDHTVTEQILKNYGVQIDADKNKTAQNIKNRIDELKIKKSEAEESLKLLENSAGKELDLDEILGDSKEDFYSYQSQLSGTVAKDEVANNAQSTEAIIGNWAAAEEAAMAYGATAAEAAAGKVSKSAPRVHSAESYGITYKIETEDTTGDVEKTDYEQKREDLRQDLIAYRKNEIDLYERQIADLTSGWASMVSESGKKVQEAAKKDTEKTIEYLENEKDLYHDINIEIQRLENSMEELERQQEKLYGQDLLNNLSKQLDLLEKQENAQRRKLEIAKAEAEALKVSLAAQGTTFNSDGTISNYQALYDQKLAYVNSIKASGDEEAAEAAEKDFEQWQEDFARYDELISSEIFEIEQSIQDAVDKAIEKQIEAFDYEIQLKLDLKDANREWNDFKKEMLEEDDILGRAGFNLETFKTYLGDEGTINTLTEKSNTLLDQLKQINETGTSSIYGDNKAKLMEDLQAVQEELMSAMKDQKDILEEIEQAYFDMLDAAQEAFDEQIAQYEAINEVYSHGLNVVNLLYGEDAYAEMEGFYQKQMENNTQMIDMQKKTVDYYKGLLQDASLSDDERAEVQRKLQEAQAALHNSVESQIELIITKYQNAINKIFKTLEDQMSGGKGLSYIQEEWDLINQNAEMYLDEVNSAYEIEKLSREYNKAIDATDSLSAQRKLNELMEQQLKGLREKDKLTQYEVDRANALLDIELKRIALEEAQQNKSKMRLRRDASGNYSYQFVSDEDSVAQAQQELADAQNSLYNLDKDALQENQEAALNMWTEFKDKYMEIMSDVTLSDEEREARLQLIREQYGEMYNNLLMQNADIRKNLEGTALEEMAQMNLDYTMEQIVPTWNSGVQQMMESFAGEGGLIPACSGAFGELTEITNQYAADLGTLEATAGYNLGNIAGYTTDIATEMTTVLNNNADLIAKYEEQHRQLGLIKDTVSSLMTDYKTLATNANAAADAIIRAREEEAKGIETPEDKPSDGQPGDDGKGDGQPGNDGKGKEPVDNSSKAEGVAAAIWLDSNYAGWGTGATRASRLSSKGVAAAQSIINSQGPNGQLYRKWWKKDRSGYKFGAFDTGGYTGDWTGNDGRVALLHKKELVLNAKDTKNILQAVDVVRQIDGIMSSIMGNAFDRVNNQVRGLNSISFPVGGPTSSEAAVAQHIEINADFPGVEKASEIISAFENLTNMATQYAFRTDR